MNILSVSAFSKHLFSIAINTLRSLRTKIAAQKGSTIAKYDNNGYLTIPNVSILDSEKFHTMVLKLVAELETTTFELIEVNPSCAQMGMNTAGNRNPDLINYTCNICGKINTAIAVELASNREAQSCVHCRSSLRMRSIIDALSSRLFNDSLALPDFPVDLSIKGIGMSDWEGYSVPLSQKLSYTNTYYHKEPKLDIINIDSESEGKYDFIISSDVFEHIPPPVSRAFRNTHKLLKPGGIFILTVPYEKTGETREHFPDLYDYHLEKNSTKERLINVTRDGERQVFENLVFHGGDGFTLEMRMFSEPSLIKELEAAGFTDIKIHYGPCAKFGIVWPISYALPVSARRA